MEMSLTEMMVPFDSKTFAENWKAGQMSKIFSNGETTMNRLKALISNFISFANPTNSSDSSRQFWEPVYPGGQQPSPFPSSSNQTPSFVNVGQSDLDPFGGVGIPRIVGGPGGYNSSNPNNNNPFPGNMVGPDHPMFHPYHDPNLYAPPTSVFPFPGSSGGPRPRFDPYVPITGPNQEDFIDFGGDGSHPNPNNPNNNRRRQPPRTFPGEPNPDHLKPPGF
jgi:hypothetical protein